ncbi:MAG: hypothetical protein GEU80_16440 [Dehalococcoidia bacterium]|nr:hypothetical protein [Dehalococcoidia bacterium]
MSGTSPASARYTELRATILARQGYPPGLATPGLDLDPERQRFWMGLIEEEHEELRAALTQRDLVAFADALGDLIWVLFGTAATHGIDLDAVLLAIHRSNLTKSPHTAEHPKPSRVNATSHRTFGARSGPEPNWRCGLWISLEARPGGRIH